MDTENTDSILVEKVRLGDKQAFDLLVRKYQFKIRSLVSTFIKDYAEQEDIVQETFIKAYHAISKFRGESAFYTWLYRIAVNTAKNHLLTNNRRPPSQDVDVDDLGSRQAFEGLVDNQSPEEILHNDQLVLAIRKAIDALPQDLRDAIQLREFSGLSYEDIAIVMNCPIGTVRSRIFRARESIEKSISHIVGD